MMNFPEALYAFCGFGQHRHFLDASPAYREGRAHRLDGGYKSRAANNPHQRGSDDWDDWHRGYMNYNPLLRLRK